MNKRIKLVFFITIAVISLTSCIFPKRSKKISPSDYPDVVWVSTNDLLELYNGDNGMYGVLKNDYENIKITISWNNTCEYYTIYTDDVERSVLLKGQISNIEDMMFKLTVEEDKVYDNKYKEFILIEKKIVSVCENKNIKNISQIFN